MSLIYNATFDKNTRKLSFEDKAGNEIYSFIVPERAPTVDDITKPLTFRATQDGSTVKLAKYGSPDGAFQTSNDGGNTWTDYTIGTDIALNTGDEVSFRTKSDRTSVQNYNMYFYFAMTGKIEAWHNVMSLYRTNDFSTYESVVGYAFSRLFSGCASLTKAPVLPATTLADSCYWEMFNSCTSLTEAPELPATALAVDCYFSMFQICRSLVKAPELSATTLASRCCWQMFYGCSSLNEVHCKIPSSYSSSQISSYAADWLSGVSATGTFYTNADANWPSGISGIPTGWTRIPKPAPTPAVDDITKPLTFKATQDGSTVKLIKNGSPEGSFQTSRDGGKTWIDYYLNTYITLNTGDEVSFRAKADRTSAQYRTDYFSFMMTGKIEAWHNVMSLYRTSDFAAYNTAMRFAFISMFEDCTSLTKAPILPATTLVEYCYKSMFRGCTSLTEAPALPATKLTEFCYQIMFGECTSLTKAPALPATKLARYCYDMMFTSCRSLTKAPALPATKLTENCYSSMFSNCSIKEVRISATTTATDALKNWLFNGSSTGDFYCDPNATIFPTDSVSGIPKGWTRHALADYPATP